MKKKFFLSTSLLMGLLISGATLTSCSNEVQDLKNGEQEALNSGIGLTLEVAQKGVTVTQGTYTFTNLSTGKKVQIPYGKSDVSLPQGKYDVVFEGEGERPKLRGDLSDLTIYGELRGITVAEDELNLALRAVANGKNAEKDFVIVELFLPSTQDARTGRQYNGGDQYVIIGNNTDKTLYADGLVLMESNFTNVLTFDYQPNIRPNALPVSAVMQIPGSGQEYPVKPGETIIICDNAINHKEVNSNSIDLSGAQFEWFIDRPNAIDRLKDIPTPGKVYLNEIYNATKTRWTLNKQGNKTYAIGRLPEGMDKEKFLAEQQYLYKFPIKENIWSKEMSTYKFNNEWIIDAVNVSPLTMLLWTVSPLDDGFTYIGEVRDISTNYGKSVIRESLMKGDRKVWVDDNDSQFDFLPSQKASLLAK